jgi:HD superfamily phosphodiesterase
VSWLEDRVSEAIPREWFQNVDGLHGVGHARRVVVHADALAVEIGLCLLEATAVHKAALWHDIGRTHDGVDWTHGMASVAKVLDLGLGEGIRPGVLDLAFFAMEHHSMDDRVGEARAAVRPDATAARRVLWVLKDADGLDRIRLGDLDAARLRLECSRARVGAAEELLACEW